MAVPVLKLDLAPPSNLWRMNHAAIGWAVLATGCLILAGSLGFTWRAYRQAASAGRDAVTLANKTRSTAQAQQKVLAELRSIDVAKELPRWRLAEKIFTERSLPWSRLTSELERSLVQDVRIRSLQRTRSSDLRVQLRIKGEARSREAEAGFVESLQKNTFFEQVTLEREGERQGGGVDFDYTLAVQPMPPAYAPLPKYGPAKAAAAAAAAPKAGPQRPAPAPHPAAAAAPRRPQLQSPAEPPPSHDVVRPEPQPRRTPLNRRPIRRGEETE